MGDRAYRLIDDKSENAVSALFYITNKEIAKPEDEMDIDLIEKCADAIPQIDDSYAVPEEQTDAFVKKMMAVYDEKHKTVDDQPDVLPKVIRRKLSKRLKVILISAVIAVLLSGVAVSSRIDILSLLTNDLENHNEWENGETRVLDNEEIVYDTNAYTYNSFEELIDDKDLDIIYPHGLSNKYVLTSLFYIQKEVGISVSAVYKYDDKDTIELYIYSDDSSKIEIDDYKKKIINDQTYFFQSSNNNYQAMTVIDDNIYVFESSNEKALNEIIKKTK